MRTPVSPALKLVAILCLLAPAAAQAAEPFPNRPVRLVVPLFTGAATDIVARRLGESLAQGLGQSVVVDNRPGASTTLGANLVAKSTPDGHTLLVATTSTLAVVPNVMKTPYDTVKDLQPIAAFCVAPFVFLTSAESKFRTLDDLLGAARANPGKVSYGSSGTGTITHMAVELLGLASKVNFAHVPYKGVTGAYVDVIAGRLDFLTDAPASSQGQIKAGRMRALAVTGPKRSSLMPGVPTVAELGLREAESDFVTGVVAPAGTPRPVVARLQGEILRIARSQEFRDFLAAQGYDSQIFDGAEFSNRVRNELAVWARVVRERGIKAE